MIIRRLKLVLFFNIFLIFSCLKVNSESQIKITSSPSIITTPKASITVQPSSEQLSSKPVEIKKNNFSILALGDSYTIGESVKVSERWTSQLIEKLKNSKINSSEKTIAMTGWTTNNLINSINTQNLKNEYDFVYLLIGVNNQYQGLNKENYRVEFKSLLNRSIQLAQNKSNNVFVISIPDWGVTTFSQNQDREKIGKEIDHFNLINKEESLKEKVNYIDINPISKKALNDKSYIADDGLHPSGKMYSEWTELIFNQTIERIKLL